MKTLLQIRKILQNHADEIRKRYGLTNLAVFGSIVRGDLGKESDIDILAEVERPIGLIALCSAENYLTDIVGIKVDLVLKRSIRTELRDQILGEAVAI